MNKMEQEGIRSREEIKQHISYFYSRKELLNMAIDQEVKKDDCSEIQVEEYRRHLDFINQRIDTLRWVIREEL